MANPSRIHNKPIKAMRTDAPLGQCPHLLPVRLPSNKHVLQQCTFSYHKPEELKSHAGIAHAVYEAEDPNATTINQDYLNTCTAHSLYFQMIRDMESLNKLNYKLLEEENKLIATGGVERGDLCSTHRSDAAHEVYEISVIPKNLARRDLQDQITETRCHLHGLDGYASVSEDIAAVQAYMTLGMMEKAEEEKEAARKKA